MEDGYKGIEDRKSQVEFGLKVDYETNLNNLLLSGEIRGGDIGNIYKVSLSRPQPITEKLLFIPELTFTLMDKNLVNHYFEITKSEVINPKNYKLNKSYQTNEMGHAFSIGLTGVYNINSDWSTFALSEFQFLSDNISDSPLVKNKTNYSIGVGLKYRFR